MEGTADHLALMDYLGIERCAPYENGGIVGGERPQNVGKGGFALPVFSENQGAGAEGCTRGRFGRLKPPDILDEFDLSQHSEIPVFHIGVMLSPVFMHYQHSKSAFQDS